MGSQSGVRGYGNGCGRSGRNDRERSNSGRISSAVMSCGLEEDGDDSHEDEKKGAFVLESCCQALYSNSRGTADHTYRYCIQRHCQAGVRTAISPLQALTYSTHSDRGHVRYDVVRLTGPSLFMASIYRGKMGTEDSNSKDIFEPYVNYVL